MRRYSAFAIAREAARYHQGWERAWAAPEPKAAYDVIIVGAGGHGLATAYYEFQSAENSLRVGVHHGVILWALVQVLGSLPDLIDGFERSLVVIEKRDES